MMESIITAIGALIAAWFGYYLASRKFRKEKTFEARMKWHNELAEITKRLYNKTRSLPVVLNGNLSQDQINELVSEIIHLSFNFQELAELSTLYASGSTHTAIKSTLIDMSKAVQPFVGSNTEIDDNFEEYSKEAFEKSVEGLDHVYNLLARDLRLMMNLEELLEHDNL